VMMSPAAAELIEADLRLAAHIARTGQRAREASSRLFGAGPDGEHP
jgi:hypothetical protein